MSFPRASLRRRALAPLLLLLGAADAPAQWSTDVLSEARFGPAAAAVGPRVLFAGGYCATASDAVDLYDAERGTWSSALLSAPRVAVSAATIGSRVFFAGGRDASGPSDVIDVYDDATATWSTATLPTAQADAVGLNVGGKLLFAGGSTGTPTDLVQIYDAASDTWSAASLSEPREDLAGAAVGSKALFAGGWTGSAVASAVVDIYDDATGTWTTAALSQARAGLTATRVGSKVLFAGGGTFLHGNSAVVDIYDDDTGTWSVATLSQPRGELRATSVGARALFAGGFDGVSGSPSDVVDVFDDRTGTWSVAHLSGARWDLAAATAGGRAVFAGGVRWTGCTDAVDVYDLCAEPVGASYCGPAVPNSTGVGAQLSVAGCVLVEHDDVTLVASDLPPNQAGYFLNARAPGASNPPGSQGILCLGGASIGRYAKDVASSGDAGVLRLALDLAHTPTPSGPVAIAPGETWYFTAWYRDANPGPTSNFTDARVVPFE